MVFVLLVLTVLSTAGAGFGLQSSRGYAEPSSPPPPPGIIPTPIGTPPGPPTAVPTATPPIPTTTPTTAPSPGAVSPTPTKAAAAIDFSLDAVRVSNANNYSGDMTGLAAAVPGSTVWLMMFFTVKKLTTTTKRVTSYQVQYRGRTLWSASYKGSNKPTDTGRFSRYTVYQIPSNLPYGQYLYRAVLTLGTKSQSKTWKFRLASHAQKAHAGQSSPVAPGAHVTSRGIPVHSALAESSWGM